MTVKDRASQVLAGRFVELLPRLFRSLTRRERNPLSRGRISVPQMLALHYLSGRGVARMSEIARFLSIKMGSATGLVDRLIKAGFVKRSSDPGDRRVVWVEITPSGRRVVDTVMSERRKTVSGVFAKIPSGEREQYVKTFEKVCQILEAG